MKWYEIINAANKCRDTAYFAKNEKFQRMWHNKADELDAKVVGQPWLRAYDGEWK